MMPKIFTKSDTKGNRGNSIFDKTVFCFQLQQFVNTSAANKNVGLKKKLR